MCPYNGGFEVERKIVYAGDTQWTDEIIKASEKVIINLSGTNLEDVYCRA